MTLNMSPKWMDSALCAETSPELFFPEQGGSVLLAKKVCGACDVQALCLEYALVNGLRDGVWGGKSELQRARLRREA